MRRDKERVKFKGKKNAVDFELRMSAQALFAYGNCFFFSILVDMEMQI